MWIFKPVNFNRGRGVQIFNNLEELNTILNEIFYYGIDNNNN